MSQTKERESMLAQFEANAAELKPQSWQFLALELARGVVLYRKEKDYWQGYWVESLARNILAKDSETNGS